MPNKRSLRQRIIFFLASIAMAIAGSLAVGAAGANDDTNPTSTAGMSPAPLSDVIQEQDVWCGMWSGSNFDVTVSVNCDGQQMSSQQQPNTNSSQQNQKVNPNSYAALGDSVAAGLGLNGSNGSASDNSGCGRSSSAYPYQVASQTGLNLTLLACSGATAGDLVTKQHSSGQSIPAQLNAAYANGTPTLITITAGANDLHWVDYIRACYSYDCTYSGYGTAADVYRSLLKVKLKFAMADIQNRSGNNPPKVILTGYYIPVPDNCPSLSPNPSQNPNATPSQNPNSTKNPNNASFTNAELSQIRQEAYDLNYTIQQTAQAYPFARFAPVDFSGHDLCSADSWIQGIGDPAPLHPTAEGQNAIAQAVVNTYHSW